jgi:hypothetical protein
LYKLGLSSIYKLQTATCIVRRATCVAVSLVAASVPRKSGKLTNHIRGTRKSKVIHDTTGFGGNFVKWGEHI